MFPVVSPKFCCLASTLEATLKITLFANLFGHGVAAEEFGLIFMESKLERPQRRDRHILFLKVNI